MTLAQWIAVGAALLGGGAMGAVIGVLATTWRNRIQPIGVRKELIPFVNKQVGEAGPKAEILFKVADENKSFSNLILGRVTLHNTSNKDYEEFKFGITLSGLSMAVYLQTESQDRYHEISASPQIDFNHLDNEIDFSLRPFNRNDVYSASMFILPVSDHDSLEISLNTKHPVRFVELTAYRAVATSIVWEVIKTIPVIGASANSIRSLRLKR